LVWTICSVWQIIEQEQKALATLIQIAGRSGRKHDAKVIVQTFNEGLFNTFIEDFDSSTEEENIFQTRVVPTLQTSIKSA